MTAPPVTRRVYRDAVALNVVLALVIVVFAWLTGGDVARAALFAMGFFVLATAWTWGRFWRRGRRA